MKKNNEEESYTSDGDVSGKENDKVTQKNEDRQDTSKDGDNTPKDGVNYHQIYVKASKKRHEIEAKAAAAQKKQADDVNKKKEWEGVLLLEKCLVCVLKCTKERDEL
jgi:hypothetical protein